MLPKACEQPYTRLRARYVERPATTRDDWPLVSLGMNCCDCMRIQHVDAGNGHRRGRHALLRGSPRVDTGTFAAGASIAREAARHRHATATAAHGRSIHCAHRRLHAMLTSWRGAIGHHYHLYCQGPCWIRLFPPGRPERAAPSIPQSGYLQQRARSPLRVTCPPIDVERRGQVQIGHDRYQSEV